MKRVEMIAEAENVQIDDGVSFQARLAMIVTRGALVLIYGEGLRSFR